MANVLKKQYASVFLPILSEECYDNFLLPRIEGLNVTAEILVPNSVLSAKSLLSPEGQLVCSTRRSDQLQLFTENSPQFI